jgi:hypothetical protein
MIPDSSTAGLRIRESSICFALSALLAIALARVAVWLQVAGFATVFIFPALCGAALAFGTVFVAKQLGGSSRGPIVQAAIVGSIIMAAAEHGFFYLEYRHQFEAKLHSNPQVELLATMSPDPPMPATFWKFMAAEAPAKWPLWSIDALTMITIAALTTLWITSEKATSN